MLIVQFLPMIFFVLLYVGTGLYFTYLDIPNAFYQLTPTIAILPALILAWILCKGSNQDRMNAFVDGVRHRNVITMCIIYLLAGAFSTVTTAIGSVDATVNMALSYISPQFLLIGIFITGAFVSTAIGSAIGTIATIGPIALGFAQQGIFPMALGMGTVVGSAMFGDNLSLISDTTIAAVLSQHADFRKKLMLNSIVAGIASIFNILMLYTLHTTSAEVVVQPYSFLLVLPYMVLITIALCGVNVFVVLTIGLLTAGTIGYITSGYSLISFSNDIAKGFFSVYDILVLALLAGGLSGLSGNEEKLVEKLENSLLVQGGKKLGQFMIAGLVSIADVLLANNTIAIIFTGEIARTIAKKNKIPAHYSAAWLDIFSCVMQGIIPHGAQVLLASGLAGISPLTIASHVYYCYILGIVAFMYIATTNIKGTEHE